MAVRTIRVLIIIKTVSFRVFKRLLYLTYSKFDITVLTISIMELHVYSLRINTITHFETHKNAQSQLVTVQCSLSKCQQAKSKV